MKYIQLEDAQFDWVVDKIKNLPLSLDDNIGTYFDIVKSLAQASLTEVPPTVPQTPTPEPTPQSTEAADFTPTPTISTRRVALADVYTSEMYERYMENVQVPARRLPTTQVLELATGEFAIPHANVVLKKAPPGAGTCIEIVAANDSLGTNQVIPQHQNNTQRGIVIELTPDSHYNIRGDGYTIQLNKYVADLVVAFMKYHRPYMT